MRRHQSLKHMMSRSAKLRKRNFSTRDQVSGSVYVHWPFCARRCTYCNFNKYIVRKQSHEAEAKLHSRMESCLVREATTLLRMSGFNRIESVFFGGGTPSLMRPGTVKSLVDRLASFDTDKTLTSAEVTLEANPSDLCDVDKIQGFVDAGVNRISLGIQSFADANLKLLNRDHDSHQARVALESCMKVLPDSVSADLIFGLPGQTLQDWRVELESLIHDFGIKHASLYQLTLERGTQLWKDVTRGKILIPDEDTAADMYDLAVETFESNGLGRYEVSNFASAGHESVHNRRYWRAQDYIGVGPGAHGRFVPRVGKREDMYTRACDVLKPRTARPDIRSATSRRQSRIQTLEPEPWMAEVEAVGHGTRKMDELTEKEVLEEALAAGIRTAEGLVSQQLSEVISRNKLEERWSFVPVELVQFLSAKGREFVQNGTLMCGSDNSLKLSHDGLKFADLVTPYLLIALDKLLSARGKHEGNF